MIARFKRKDFPEHYVKVYRSVLEDKNLSLKAKGLHAWMRSFPYNWQFYVVDMQKRLKEGRDALNGALKELLDNGYLEREHLHKAGKFIGYLYIIYPVKKAAFDKYIQSKDL